VGKWLLMCGVGRECECECGWCGLELFPSSNTIHLCPRHCALMSRYEVDC